MENNLNYYITTFFKDYLPNVKGVSKNTILSYRDTFSFFLQYLEKFENKDLSNLRIDDINDEIIVKFLLYLENNKNNSVSTRNLRLAAIQSFYNYLKIKELSYFDICTQILSIPIKKAPKTTISYFSKDEIEILINTPNTNNKNGFRDYVLLLTMYETAARAQEICDLKRNQIQIKDDYSFIILIGKGNKTRNIPINKQLTDILMKYINVFEINFDDFLFKNKNKQKLTTKGIEYILIKYIKLAKEKNLGKFSQHYSNHSMRHTKAMHLLESGVNLIYIRDFLGHASITTTEIYAKANPIIKEKQILKLSNSINTNSKYNSEEKEELLEFLKTL